MNIATVIFTYNRSHHTERVLDALSKNRELPEKLFVFQDGLKQESDRIEWEKVNKIIQEIQWCNCQVCVSDKNKGLAQSIISGLNRVFDSFDAVIVLEDDCVTHPMFMEYMVTGLEKYELNEEVFTVEGYAWPVDVKPNGADTYFTGRISSWGWGTWKNRWIKYKTDYQILRRIKSNPDLSARFHIWGEDCESFLLGNIEGRCDSWAVFWALTVIENKGYCLVPYDSLVENIGYDGSGIHCRAVKRKQYLRDRNNFKEISFPKRIEFPEDCELSFSDYCAWSSPLLKERCYNQILIEWLKIVKENKNLCDKLWEDNIKKISIWGKGKLCDLLLDEFENRIEVLSIVETNPIVNFYKNIPVVSVFEMPKDTQLLIVIPIYDMDRIKRKSENIIQCDIIGIEQLIMRCRK